MMHEGGAQKATALLDAGWHAAQVPGDWRAHPASGEGWYQVGLRAAFAARAPVHDWTQLKPSLDAYRHTLLGAGFSHHDVEHVMALLEKTRNPAAQHENPLRGLYDFLRWRASQADAAGGRPLQIHIHNSTIGALAAAAESASSLGAVTNPLPAISPPAARAGGVGPVVRSLATSGRAVLMAVGALATLVLIVGGMRSRSSGRVALASVARIKMDMAPKQVAAITGVVDRVDQNGWMEIPLAEGAPFKHVSLQWKKEQSHISTIELSDLQPWRANEIRGGLQKHLGRRFINDSEFRWSTCSLSFKDGKLTASTYANWEGGPEYWEKQVETLWAIVQIDALGLKGEIDSDKVKHWLGGGYSLKEVARVDPMVATEQSYDALKELFPGVYTYVGSDASTQMVALDHPAFGLAQFGWKNERGGKLVSVTLRPPRGKDRFVNQGAIHQCLQSALGTPQKRTPGEQLQEQNSDTWVQRDGSKVILTPIQVNIYQEHGPVPPSLLQAVIPKLDACAK